MGLKTFVISTSAHPQDVIVMTTDESVVILDDAAATGIVTDSVPPIISGGEF